jgi:tetratricopeptide (TPR) repeat protein
MGGRSPYWPRKERAIRAHTALVRSCIYLKDYTAAEAQLQLLTERYGEDEKLPRVLNEIAKGYREQKLYDDAEPLSQYVLDNFPGRDECLWAQKSVVLARLGLGNKEGAKTATEAMLARFQTHKQANQAIADVAQAYRDRRMHAQARDLYKFNLDRYPNAKNAVWWVRGFVNQSAEIGDDASINAGIDKLFMQYSDKQGLPTVALHIGAQLCSKDHPRAAEMLQYVIDNHRDHKAALNAQVRMGHIYVRQDDDGRAESTYQDVMSYYANDPGLPRAIFLMAEGYWERALMELGRAREITGLARESFEKTLSKCEKVISQYPGVSPPGAEVYRLAGECCSYLGQHDKALEYFQGVVDNWPDYPSVSNVLLRIGRKYEYLKRSGVIPAAEAESMTASAYRRLVRDYPNCNAARIASKWLNNYDRMRGEEK